MKLFRWNRQPPSPKATPRAPKMITHAKAERLRRKAEQEGREKRKSLWLLVGVVLLMAGAVVADMVFIGWQRHQRHLRHQHHQSLTNRPARTNQPLSRAIASSLVPSTNSQAEMP